MIKLLALVQQLLDHVSQVLVIITWLLSTFLTSLFTFLLNYIGSDLADNLQYFQFWVAEDLGTERSSSSMLSWATAMLPPTGDQPLPLAQTCRLQVQSIHQLVSSTVFWTLPTQLGIVLFVALGQLNINIPIPVGLPGGVMQPIPGGSVSLTVPNSPLAVWCESFGLGISKLNV